MPAPSQRQRRRLRAKATGLTNFLDAFKWVAANDANRVNVLVEGDSWFAYPKDWLIHGEASNVITSIFSTQARHGSLNGYCVAGNGDTAAEMMSGKQLKSMRKLLKKNGKLFDVCLFSAGGNDVVGPDDLEPLLNTHVAGFTANDCINEAAFVAKLDDIEKHFRTLLQLRKTHAPGMKIITHTYDILKPSDKGAEFLWGVKVSDSWILPTMLKKDIPTDLQTPIVRILLERFRDRLLVLQAEFEDFFVVDTQGTLRPGHATDWLNEIHPTPSGFKRVAAKIYAEMKAQFERLPT